MLSENELDGKGDSAPWKLAAGVLLADSTLNWRQLWDVIRWYAHHRGYDGNREWARGSDDSEDTEKEANARQLMADHDQTTMAGTVCAILGIAPDSEKKASTIPFRTLNAAFPRSVVRHEVRSILESHRGKLSKLDGTVIDWIVGPSNGDEPVPPFPQVPELQRIPRRYQGSLLFGQLIPRFDNRIISTCPITFARVYAAKLEESGDPKDAYRVAVRDSKVPAKACREFLDYRWAILLANIKVEGATLSAEDRQALHQVMMEKGRLTAKELQKTVETITDSVAHNLEATFSIHPDAEKALVHDPALHYYHRAANSGSPINRFWKTLPEAVRTRALGRWKKRRPVTPAWMLEQLDKVGQSTEALQDAIDAALLERKRNKKKELRYHSREQLLSTHFGPDPLSGRAPYTREVMREAVAEVLAGRDPRSEGGVLFRSSEVLAAERLRPIDHLTNNHLIRHRLKIVARLFDHIVQDYAENDPTRIKSIVVEVARDLQEFSGMSAKEITAELNGRLKDFKSAVAYLEKHAPDLPVSGGLIRKCRIAMDLDWKCPFTGEHYDPESLPYMDREHIIPYADRPTNALSALVLTFPEVNAMKGKQTAYAFIAANEGKPVRSRENLQLFTLKQYRAFVDKLDTRSGHDDDRRRKHQRKKWLDLEEYEPRNSLDFTEGALTQSSHLMRLAARQFEKKLPDLPPHAIIHLPGQVTAQIRKSWNLMDHLAAVVPEVREFVRNKQAIRDMTHLHHAVDAAAIGLAAHYLPKHGDVWEALLKRDSAKTDADRKLLYQLGVFKRGNRGRLDLVKPPEPVLQELEHRLGECRVVQHVPSDMGGMPAELTTWGVERIEGEGKDAEVFLRQNSTEIKDGVRISKPKTDKQSLQRLVGVDPPSGSGKLKEIKGAIILKENYGIALDPAPEVIPYFKVWNHIGRLKKANGGKPVRVLRNGMLIRVKEGNYRGVWKVRSCKNNRKSGLLLRMTAPHMIPYNKQGVSWCKDNVQLSTLIKSGLEILPNRLTGRA